jgi:hypothetical protein
VREISWYGYGESIEKAPTFKRGTRLPSCEAQRKFFTTLADKEGISVKWSTEPVTPHCALSGKSWTIVLNTPSLATVDRWQGEAHHEVSHVFEEVRFCYDVMPALTRYIEKDVHNILADYLCELCKFDMYPGRDRILYEMRKTLEMYKPGHLEASAVPGIAALIEYDVGWREEWQGVFPEFDGHPDSGKYIRRFDEIKAYERVTKLLVSQDADEMHRIIMQICEAIMKPMTDEEGDDSGDGEGKGSGRGKASDSADPERGGHGSYDDGETEVDKRPEDTEDTEETEAGAEEDEDEGESADTSREDDGGSSDSGELPDTEGSELPDDITRIDEVKESVRDEDYMPFIHHDHIIPNYNVSSLQAAEIKEAVGKSTVSKRVKRYLKIVSKDSYSYGHKRGKLHVKNMHRIYTPAEQPKIFKRKDRAVLKTDTAVQIMLDCSGSMNGHRYTVGSACCVAISQCLTDLRIVHEVLGFSEYRRLWTYYFKTFEQNMSSDTLVRGLSSSNIRLRENADGESVLYGAERLSQRQERHKLMIVLSDGQPAGTYTGNGHWYLKMVSNAIEASGIDLLGIGIQTEAVKRFYNNHYVVSIVADLDSVLFSHLKKSLVD